MASNNTKEKDLGIEKMEKSTVVICSIVRDCAKPLKKNIPIVERLRGMFQDSTVVIVENDSIDGTKKVLSQWKAKSSNIHIIGSDTNQITIPKESTIKVNPFYSLHRIEKMSKFRNEYIEYVEKMDTNFDYMIVIDLDINYFDINGIINSFGQTSPWDTITSNGTKFLYKKLKRIFHDTYALREIEEGDRPQTEEIIEANRIKWNKLKKGTPMIPVISGFNGLAIYRYSSIKGCRYKATPNNDARVQVLCEHVSFHMQMIENGNGNIFVNPSQITKYKTNILKELGYMLRHMWIII